MGNKIQRIYVGTNQVRPHLRTFTISREEKSNMSSGWTYSDDAAGLTAGSTAFDEFFGYSAVRLNTSGVETMEITQSESGGDGKLDITQLGTLTSGDNVMIKFPIRGIKMSKSGSVVTLSITEKLNMNGYQYYAFCNSGTISNPGTPSKNMYIGAYKGYVDSNVLKSRSGKSPTASVTPGNFSTYAKANGTGFNMIGFYQRMYIAALYIMKYGNPNSSSVIGQGVVNSSKKNTGGTNSQLDATYGTTSTSTQVKLFGLEDWRGNLYDRVGGCIRDSSRNVWAGFTWSGNDGAASPYEIIGTGPANGGGGVAGVVGTNTGMFLPSSLYSGSSFTTYYCDEVWNYSNALCTVGGCYNNSNGSAGVFLTNFADSSKTNARFGSRLVYI